MWSYVRIFSSPSTFCLKIDFNDESQILARIIFHVDMTGNLKSKKVESKSPTFPG